MEEDRNYRKVVRENRLDSSNSSDQSNIDADELPSSSIITQSVSHSTTNRKGGYAKVWTKVDFDKFYQAADMFKDSVKCNAQIAKFMGEHIDPK